LHELETLPWRGERKKVERSGRDEGARAPIKREEIGKPSALVKKRRQPSEGDEKGGVFWKKGKKISTVIKKVTNRGTESDQRWGMQVNSLR